MDARMFDGGNPDLALRVERSGEMVHDHVVRLGRAAGPDDVERMAAEKRGELFARVGRARCPRARRPGAGWTDCRRLFSVTFEPGFARLAHDRRGGVVIEVNHRPDRIQLAATLASFLWALVKGQPVAFAQAPARHPFRRGERREPVDFGRRGTPPSESDMKRFQRDAITRDGMFHRAKRLYRTLRRFAIAENLDERVDSMSRLRLNRRLRRCGPISTFGKFPQMRVHDSGGPLADEETCRFARPRTRQNVAPWRRFAFAEIRQFLRRDFPGTRRRVFSPDKSGIADCAACKPARRVPSAIGSEMEQRIVLTQSARSARRFLILCVLRLCVRNQVLPPAAKAARWFSFPSDFPRCRKCASARG